MTAFVRPLSWPLLPVPDAHGDLAFPSLEQSISQMIRVILLTRPGEQLRHPEFGAGLTRYLDEPNTIETRRAIHAAVIESLTRWEPRMLVEDVEVSEVPDQPTVIRISIKYQVRRTGQHQQQSLAMKLGG
jgi:Bacteriophage baseplate protein W